MMNQLFIGKDSFIIALKSYNIVTIYRCRVICRYEFLKNSVVSMMKAVFAKSRLAETHYPGVPFLRIPFCQIPFRKLRK